MDSLTYAIVIGLTFLLGIFIFTYFETPRKTLAKGIKKVKSIRFLNIKKSEKPSLMIPSSGGKSTGRDDRDELRIYVHEY